jgi:16S rRNA (guanine966-N2)-methyltransferase
LRIIGGNFKGRRLFSVKGFRVRPTKDKHRESIFNMISQDIPGAVVLDLFAGTGALGIEALSRGADFAVFVDSYPHALTTISKNIKSCHLESRAKILRWNILKNLNCLKPYRFDIVLMDPPYDIGAVGPALLNLQQSECLKNDAVIVVEHTFNEPFPDQIMSFKQYDQRRYGKTLVSFFNFMLMESA